MSPGFRIYACPGRAASKEKSRSLLRSSEPPKSPLFHNDVCDAIESNGAPCSIVLPTDEHAWCLRHLEDMKQMEHAWYATQVEAEKVLVNSPETAKQKVSKLRLAVELRRQIRERFFPRGGDTTDYIRWITELERELRGLADCILMQNLTRRPTPELFSNHSPNIETIGEKIVILRSPLDPKIPVSSLSEMPDDGTILVLKHFYTDLCAEAVRRLYRVVPDLNDGTFVCSPGLVAMTPHDGGTDILRAWFRIMIFNDSEAEALEHATRSHSIDDFLHGCYASQLEAYCDFFEKAWRPHAAQYLRVAICAQTLAGQEMKTVQILGGEIPSTSEGLKMKKPSWDILYRWFPSLLTPWTLASICQNFEDYITINKLLMVGLYREHWFDPQSIGMECTTGIYLGFIPSKKGDFSAAIGTHTSGEEVTEVQARNYVTGQMAIGDPLTSQFLEELKRRQERVILVVYEGTNADATVYPSEHDLFISRRRSAKSGKDLEQADWQVEMTLEDVKNDLRMRKSSTYDPIVVDSWQFIIIDRVLGQPFALFEIIHDALLMLHGDPTPRMLAKKVVRDIIPTSVQEIFLEEMQLDSPISMSIPPPPFTRYEGNRQRFWQTERMLPYVHEISAPGTQPRNTNRFIQRVVEDMERHGIIRLAPSFQEPQTRPVIIQGADGLPDLYFPYDSGNSLPDPTLAPSLTLPASTCLLEFAIAFKKTNPNAIMAKGSIQTHYCAWPMPSIKRGKNRLNFATYDGHIYEWEAMPFDRPWSERAWQYFLDYYINSKFPFVMFYLTTFVICATNRGEVEKNIVSIYDEMGKRGWRIVMPDPDGWKDNIDDLRLDEIFQGTPPALTGGQDSANHFPTRVQDLGLNNVSNHVKPDLPSPVAMPMQLVPDIPIR